MSGETGAQISESEATKFSNSNLEKIGELARQEPRVDDLIRADKVTVDEQPAEYDLDGAPTDVPTWEADAYAVDVY